MIDWEMPIQTTKGDTAKRVYVGSTEDTENYDYWQHLVVISMAGDGDDEEVIWVNDEGDDENGVAVIRNVAIQ